jgi:hypothetical protein
MLRAESPPQNGRSRKVASVSWKSFGAALAFLTVVAPGCGGPDRPADDPTRGTGGSGSIDLVPEVPNPNPVPEPAPAPGGPDPTPTGALGPSLTADPSVLRELRGPLIAAALPIDAAPIGSELSNGGAGPAGRPGIGPRPGGVPGIGPTGGVGGR